MTNSLTIDELDLKLLQALQLDGRVPFSTIAELMGVSAHTVARRYQRLRASAGLRVLGRPGPASTSGRPRWMIRIRCAPDAAVTLAASIARRADTTFVALVSGSSEVICVLETTDEESAASLLLHRWPRIPSILAITAHRLLRTHYGGPDGWCSKIGALTAEQVAALRPPAGYLGSGPHPRLDDVDRILLDRLRGDGRAAHGALRASVRLSEPSVRRRLHRLRDSGALYFDLQLDPGQLGYRTIALLWLTAAPTALEAAAHAFARHSEVAFIAATTGPSNLVAAVICRDAEDLYTYLVQRVAAIGGITRVETTMVIRQVKQLV
ncbi:Lrp/AsnC family transcriptional regulator [Frankia sp. AgKG'84/4]|uniref:Lrp/AsnC family transcriptional regulator n=1 Tax=Frankia sp. AgKG'84/4 TaxID=573490 RepID=UPI00200BFC27|nr:AsnC family transcriptional regulator [Frankia sp. AgKG'84/4]MCL9795907.1 AsnC family transcriptional regulator [Frankia sp. AgKG'84/4]